jgi:hypothetical protein
MKRLIIAAVGLALVVGLLALGGAPVEAEPVASITLPDPGGTVQLYPGCNNISLTFPDGTASQEVVQAVTPAGVVDAMWRHNAAENRFEGFSPAAPQASDLLTVTFLDAVWLCVTGAPPSETATPAPPPTATPGEIVIQTCIDGTFTGWSGYTAFPLCNGQVWMQSSYSYWYYYAYRPNVVIYQTGSGYLMQVEGVSVSVYVTPVTDFIRTCIDGDFEGWEGDTVFPLCNGQVWMQSSDSYWYYYAYRPNVVIYQTGSGYRMQVEGVNETVAVVRLR